jgi:hypothetical protein
MCPRPTGVHPDRVDQQDAMLAWILAALVVLVVGACTPVQALLGVAIGGAATAGGPVVHRWYVQRRR